MKLFLKYKWMQYNWGRGREKIIFRCCSMLIGSPWTGFLWCWPKGWNTMEHWFFIKDHYFVNYLSILQKTISTKFRMFQCCFRQLVLESVNRHFSGNFSCIGLTLAGKSQMSKPIPLEVSLKFKTLHKYFIVYFWYYFFYSFFYSIREIAKKKRLKNTF